MTFELDTGCDVTTISCDAAKRANAEKIEREIVQAKVSGRVHT